MKDTKPELRQTAAFEQPFESQLFFNRPAGRLALALTGWTVVAIIAATTAFIAFRGNSFAQWLALFRPMIVYYYSWAVFALLIYQLVMRLNFSLARLPWLLLLHAGLLTFISLAMPFIVHANQWREWLYGERAIGFRFLGLFIYLFILISCLLLKSYRVGRDQERRVKAEALRTSMLENQLSMARMDVLKTQINPHFLFNALNSIAALIETAKNQQAYTAVELLGGLLRSTLDQARSEFVSLQQELEFIRCYFELEKIRYGDRLSFIIDAPADCIARKVPSLLLQPLVENAIKHAVAVSHKAVTVELQVNCDPASLSVAIRDDGPGFQAALLQADETTGAAAGSASGLGLINIRQRLQLLYGGRHRLVLNNRDSGGAEIKMTLPTDDLID